MSSMLDRRSSLPACRKNAHKMSPRKNWDSKPLSAKRKIREEDQDQVSPSCNIIVMTSGHLKLEVKQFTCHGDGDGDGDARGRVRWKVNALFSQIKSRTCERNHQLGGKLRWERVAIRLCHISPTDLCPSPRGRGQAQEARLPGRDHVIVSLNWKVYPCRSYIHIYL